MKANEIQKRLAESLDKANAQEARRPKPEADTSGQEIRRTAKEAKPAARSKSAPKDATAAQAEARLRDDIGRGKGTNFYVNKNGDVLQKILIYLPYEYVRQLKREAIDARMSLSALIEKRLRG
jgi:hypothetical protein